MNTARNYWPEAGPAWAPCPPGVTQRRQKDYIGRERLRAKFQTFLDPEIGARLYIGLVEIIQNNILQTVFSADQTIKTANRCWPRGLFLAVYGQEALRHGSQLVYTSLNPFKEPLLVLHGRPAREALEAYPVLSAHLHRAKAGA